MFCIDDEVRPRVSGVAHSVSLYFCLDNFH